MAGTTLVNIPEAIELYQSGWTTVTLGTRYGIAAETVRKHLIKAGLTLRHGNRIKPVVDGQKKCARCKQWKSLEEFHRNASNTTGYACYCRTCHSNKYRNESTQVFYKAVEKRYGLTQDEYERMYAEQGGVCYGCKRPEHRKRKGVPYRLNVDHCHRTGKVRGLLCSACNRALGLVEDNEETLLNLVRLLDYANDNQTISDMG